MERSNNRNPRERKPEVSRRDAASSAGRYSRSEREPGQDHPHRAQVSGISGLDKQRLNDLYERSSI